MVNNLSVEVRLSKSELERLLNDREILTYQKDASSTQVVLIPEKHQLTKKQIIEKLEHYGMGDLAEQVEGLTEQKTDDDQLTCFGCAAFREKAKTCVNRDSGAYRKKVYSGHPACKFFYL